MIFDTNNLYRITYGDDNYYTPEDNLYSSLDEAKKAIILLAKEEKEYGYPWWKATWRRIEKYQGGDFWTEISWKPVWGDIRGDDSDWIAVFPKYGEDLEEEDEEV